MIFHFSDGEFSDPIATSLKMWKKINSFILIIAFSVTLEKLNRNPQVCCPPPQKIFLHAFFFSPPPPPPPPTRKLAVRSLNKGEQYFSSWNTLHKILTCFNQPSEAFCWNTVKCLEKMICQESSEAFFVSNFESKPDNSLTQVQQLNHDSLTLMVYLFKWQGILYLRSLYERSGSSCQSLSWFQ